MIQPQHRNTLLIAVSILLCVYGLMWGLPNPFDFAQDSLVPTGEFAKRGFDMDAITTYRYPPTHFYLLNIVFIPLRGICNKLPSLSENEKNTATLFILAARLISVAMAIGIVRILFLLGRRLWNDAAGYAASLLFMLSPLTLYYAKNANLDIPYMFWLAWTLLIYVRILQENRKRDYLWLGLLAALAVTTKDQAYAFLLLMPVPLIWNLFRREKELPSKERLARLITGGAVFTVVFVLIHNIIFDWSGFVRHVKMITGPGSEGWRLFTRGPAGQARLLVETFLRFMDAWTLAGVALAVIGLVLAFKQKEKRHLFIALLVPAVSYYLFFPAIIGYIPTRFVLPMLLIACLFGGYGVAWLWEKTSLRPISGRAIAMLLMAWVGLAGLSVDFVMANYSRYTAQKWMESNVPADTRICWIGDMRDMPRLNEPFDPKPCEPTEQALAEANPDLLILSIPQENPASNALCMRLSSIARRHLGAWGLAEEAQRHRGLPDVVDAMMKGESRYRVAQRFASPVAPFVPDVCESLNRTIVILVKSPQP